MSSSSTESSSAPATVGGSPGAGGHPGRLHPDRARGARRGTERLADGDIVVLWLAFTAFMAIRGVVLGWRARHDAWMVTGAR